MHLAVVRDKKVASQAVLDSKNAKNAGDRVLRLESWEGKVYVVSLPRISSMHSAGV